MHKELTKKIKEHGEKFDMEHLMYYFEEAMDCLEEHAPEKHAKIMLCIHEMMYGEHFTEELLEEALCKIMEFDEMTAPYFGIQDSDKLAKQIGMSLGVKYNIYDFCYVLNMMCSDYKHVLGHTPITYAQLAKAFLEDGDAPEGKAYRYYKAMH